MWRDRIVLDNVCFPMEIAGVDKKTARENAREFLKVVELSDKEKAYPAQLSGGQKQRVAIARALAMNPTILLCDEATSALDPTTTKSILALLKDINEKYGITIVIITHSMEVVQEICTHVAIIDAGELAENGTVADVFASPKSRAAEISQYQDTLSPQTGCGKSTKRKSTAAPGECASQYTGCCHYRSPLFQAATVLQKTAPEAARKTGIFSIFGSFTPLIIISSTGSHHVSIPCDLRCP